MGRNFFGTDGVRGHANEGVLTAETVLRLATAAGRYFRNDGSPAHRVVIGKDTRLSGYMLETALTAGFTSTGMNVLLLGPIPTPAVAHLTRSLRADMGVMISASHNPHHDNGIKFFGPDGFKLSDEDEAAINIIMAGDIKLAKAENIGRAKRIDDGRFRYGERLKSTVPPACKLNGLKVVIDCANGAAHKIAPEFLWELGADVIPVGTEPNGANINHECGSTAPERASRAVLEHGADLGICLDGDADRAILIDEYGNVVDGDQILACFAKKWAEEGCLKKNTLVATVMSNLGMERALDEAGIAMLRAKVGDRYVVEAMREGGFNLGGEQSGHVVLLDHSTTGDGLLAGLQFLAMMVKTQKRASELAAQFEPVPQILCNATIKSGENPLDSISVKTAISRIKDKLGTKNRLLIRPSGTEPLIRIMVEGENEDLIAKAANELAAEIEKASP